MFGQHPTIYSVWFFPLTVSAALLSAQPAGNATLTAEQIRQDFRQTRRSLEQGHAGLYRYSNKSAMDATFDSVSAQFDRGMSTLEFYRALAPVFRDIKCGHTELLLPPALNQAVVNTIPLLPVRPFVRGDELFVFRQFAGLPELAGNWIISINGVSAAVILRQLRSLIHGDGNTATSGNRRLMDGFTFSEHLYALAGVEDPYRLVVQSDGGTTRDVVVKGSAGVDLRQMSARLYPEDRVSRDAATLRFVEDGHVAVLRIARFSDFADSDRRKRTVDWLSESFAEINARKVAGIVLDLRDNGGGNSGIAKDLVAHFFDKPFRFFADLSLPTLAADLFPLDPRIERDSFVRGSDGLYHRTSDENLGIQQPLSPGYAGPLVVLMNGGSFSATSEALSILHSARRAVFLGEESGGGYLGNTSGYGAAIILANSKLKIDIPRMAYYLAVDGKARGGAGPDRGVMPDVAIEESVADLLGKRDPQMEKAVALAAKPQRTDVAHPLAAALSPEAYVVSKFRDHDVVFLGRDAQRPRQPRIPSVSAASDLRGRGV